MPLVRVLVLVLAFGQAIGVSDFVDIACAEECGDQDWDCDDGACPPMCPACQCVLRLPANVIGTVASVEPLRAPTSTNTFFDGDDAPSSPDPREILHVPIVLDV